MEKCAADLSEFLPISTLNVHADSQSFVLADLRFFAALTADYCRH